MIPRRPLTNDGTSGKGINFLAASLRPLFTRRTGADSPQFATMKTEFTSRNRKYDEHYRSRETFGRAMKRCERSFIGRDREIGRAHV